MGLLDKPDVREHIGMSEEQIEQFEQVYSDYIQYISTRPAPANKQARAEAIAKANEFDTKLAGQIDEILLPHQRQQFQYVANYYRLGAMGSKSSFGLLAQQVVTELGISSNSKKMIAEKAAELEKEFETKKKELKKELVELKNKHRAEVLDMLTMEQREKYVELFGDSGLTRMIFGK